MFIGSACCISINMGLFTSATYLDFTYFITQSQHLCLNTHQQNYKVFHWLCFERYQLYHSCYLIERNHNY